MLITSQWFLTAASVLALLVPVESFGYAQQTNVAVRMIANVGGPQHGMPGFPQGPMGPPVAPLAPFPGQQPRGGSVQFNARFQAAFYGGGGGGRPCAPQRCARRRRCCAQKHGGCSFSVNFSFRSGGCGGGGGGFAARGGCFGRGRGRC